MNIVMKQRNSRLLAACLLAFASTGAMAQQDERASSAAAQMSPLKMSAEDLSKALKGKTREEVMALLGRPQSANETSFSYFKIGHDPYTQKAYSGCNVYFLSKSMFSTNKPSKKVTDVGCF